MIYNYIIVPREDKHDYTVTDLVDAPDDDPLRPKHVVLRV
jgi:hypothetical protein